MPSSLSSSPSSEDDKHTSADEDVTPKASPNTSGEVKDDDDDNDKTLTMPSTSQCFQPTSSPPLGRSAPTSQEATDPPAARRVETPAEEYYYFTTDMANQAAIDIEREKEKFDSLITWYKLQQEDVPNLGTCSVGTSSAAPSYVSDKGSSTPMSSQPSSHQSGTSSSNGAHSGQNGFNYSPYYFQYGGFENDPKSNDPMQCMSDPVDLDEICPTLGNFMSGPSTSAAAAAGLPPSGPSSSRLSDQPSTSAGIPPRSNDYSTISGIAPHPTRYMQEPVNVMMMMNTPPAPYPQQSPLHPLTFNQQGTPSSSSNPPSNGALKRKATEDFGVDGPSKQAKIDSVSPSETENDPMRRLEMMANPQNFRNGNTINDVVEANKKDERAAKMEKLEGIEKSVEEEMAQQAREAHMKRMQQQAAAAANGGAPPFPSPGQYPGAMSQGMPYPGMPHHPGMPPHPGMMPPGAPFSAGASHPMNGQFPPQHPSQMYPGMTTPAGYPMSAPGKIPFGSPSYPPSTPSPAAAAMAAMQQQHHQAQQAHQAHQAQQAQQAHQAHQAQQQQGRPGAGPQMPPHPSQMSAQQLQFYHMQYMAHMSAQRASQNVAHAVGLSPNMAAARPSPMGPGSIPPNHPSHPMYQHMMMMRQMHAAGMPPGSQQPGAPGHPGMAGMPPGMMPPGMMHPAMMPPGMMHPSMMPPGMMHPSMMPPGMHPGMPGMPQGMHPGMNGAQHGMPGMPGMPQGMPGMPPAMGQGMPPGMPGMPGMPGSSAAPNPQKPILMVAGNRPQSGEATPNYPNGNGQQSMYQLTPHYPPPFFCPPGNGPAPGSGPATPR